MEWIELEIVGLPEIIYDFKERKFKYYVTLKPAGVPLPPEKVEINRALWNKLLKHGYAKVTTNDKGFVFTFYKNKTVDSCFLVNYGQVSIIEIDLSDIKPGSICLRSNQIANSRAYFTQSFAEF